MLLGTPGKRKGTAMSPIKALLQDAGYSKFGADRTSPERFVIDLYRSSLNTGLDGLSTDELESINLTETSALYVLADEFADFIGLKNMNFINLLTKLWDNISQYEHPKIHGKSVTVIKPTVNILAGTTPQSLVDTIPPEAVGQGFTSRFIFVHSGGDTKKVTWPTSRDAGIHNDLVQRLVYMQNHIKGPASISPEARIILDKMYREFPPLQDGRFQHYNTRRQTLLLKLCLIVSAMRLDTTIKTQDAILANTILHSTEKQMPRALGELGRSRFSEISNAILELCHTKNLTFRDIWRAVSHDLDKESDLNQILRNLQGAGKIQSIKMGSRMVWKRHFAESEAWDDSLLDESALREEEMT